MISKKACLLFLSVFALIILLAASALLAYRHFDRMRWKARSIAEIEAVVGAKAELASSISRLESKRKPDEEQGNAEAWWISDDLMLMKSGEWLAYRYSCCHDSPLLSDHFIAKASDGKWYFSSFHFCNGMLGLLMDLQRQPKSLALFLKAFNFREFDGSSNACLDSTAFAPHSDALQSLNQD